MEAEQLDEKAKKYNLKIVAISRFQTITIENNNYYKKWAQVTRKLLEKLQIDTVDILAVSAGAVHTYTFLYYYPEKVNKTTILSGMVPLTKELPLPFHFKFINFGCRYSYWFLKLVIFLLKLSFKHFPFFSIKMMQVSTKGDDPITLSKKEIQIFLKRNILNATKNGIKGLANEICPMCRKWQFDPSAINKEITLLHGDQDTIIPLKYAVSFVENKKTFQLIPMQNEGHYSLGLENIERILKNYIA